ncbi:MAG: CPBP family intramembrane glutamic endopeptidase [Terriglobia bacterium]
MPVKLKARQFVIIAVAAAVAAVSLVIGLKYFSHAFPEATLHLRVNRAGSERIAEAFLASRGFRIAGYQHAAAFQYDDMTKLYLERTQGLARMDQLTRGPVHLWRWTHRWFRPQQKEEFSVDVTPEGRVVGFDHEIPEAAPGANLDQTEARGIAESFFTRVMKRDLGDLEFLEAERLKRPARTDYTFTWKQKRVNLGEGSLRVEVEVDGNQVAGTTEFVKVPETWVRGYEKVRSHNDAAQEVDQVFWVLLSLAMLIILVRRLRDRDVKLRLSVALGVVAAVLALLSQINNFPLAKFSYNTTHSFSSFLAGYTLTAILGAVGIGALIFLIVASSEPVYREAFPAHLSFRRYFSWRGLRTRSFFMANVVGIALTFFFFAYQTVFYLAANHLGAWAPSDIPFSNQLNTAIPWVAVLFTGFFPAVSEEMQFRAFAIPFLRKVTRSWPLALILAAFNWGFLHSAYPNQPFFIRGVEVGVGGIIIGVIMLRFGIIATLMWHYSVDALYTAFLLLRSSNHYLMVSGGLCAGIMLIPLAVALIAYLRTGTFAEEGPLTNASEGFARPPHPAAAAEVAPVVAYRPFSRRRLWAALVVIVVFAAIGSLRVYHLGEGIKVRTTRREATQAAEQFLGARHVNVAYDHTVAWLDRNVDGAALHYFLQRLSVRQTGRIVREASEPLLWAVRFYRPLQQEERFVYINAQNGKVFDTQHVLAETAPGASLSPAQALALGEQSVTAHGYKLSDFVLQDSVARRRKAREDYTLVWQAKPGDPRNVGGAHYRLTAEIAGNEVVAFSRSFKLPEKWVREQETSHLVNVLLPGAAILLGLGLIVGGVWLLVLMVKQGAVRWMASLKVAIATAILLMLSELNSIPLLTRAYNTSIALSNFRLQLGVTYAVLVLIGGALTWLLLALATSLYPDSWQVLRAASRRVWRRDAAVAVAVALAVGAGLGKLGELFANHFHAYVPVGFPGAPAGLASYSPGLGIFFQAAAAAVVSAAALGAVIYGVKLGWRRRAWWFWVGLVLLLVALVPAAAHTGAEYSLGWLMRVVPLLVAVIVLIVFFRDNVLAYVAAAFCAVTIAPMVGLLSTPVFSYRLNGVLLAVLTAIVLVWMLLPGKKEPQSSVEGSR